MADQSPHGEADSPGSCGPMPFQTLGMFPLHCENSDFFLLSLGSPLNLVFEVEQRYHRLCLQPDRGQAQPLCRFHTVNQSRVIVPQTGKDFFMSLPLVRLLVYS